MAILMFWNIFKWSNSIPRQQVYQALSEILQVVLIKNVEKNFIPRQDVSK